MEETTQCGASCSVLLAKYNSSDQIVDDEMGRARSKNGEKEKCIHVRSMWCGKLKERGHVEDLGVGDRIILK